MLTTAIHTFEEELGAIPNMSPNIRREKVIVEKSFRHPLTKLDLIPEQNGYNLRYLGQAEILGEIFLNLKTITMKQKTITVDNYKDFKPSEFVRSFLSDIEVAEKIGKPMNMDSWVGNGCLPCLGGMACLNMDIPLDRGVGDYVSGLGNAIRMGMDTSVQFYLRLLYNNKNISIPTDWSQPSIGGKIKTKAQFQKLKYRVNHYADLIEKAGY